MHRDATFGAATRIREECPNVLTSIDSASESSVVRTRIARSTLSVIRSTGRSSATTWSLPLGNVVETTKKSVRVSPPTLTGNCISQRREAHPVPPKQLHPPVVHEHDRSAAFVECLPHFCHPKSSSRTLNQPHSEALLEPGNSSTDRRFRRTKNTAGRRVPPIGHHLRKQCVVVQICHGYWTICGTMMPILPA